MPAENITITAKWDVNRYTITFNSNGGSAVSAMTVADLAMMVINGQYGVEVGTQNCFRYIKKMNK